MLMTKYASKLITQKCKLAYMPPAIQTMGERIREAREAYKLSQGNLWIHAHRCGAAYCEKVCLIPLHQATKARHRAGFFVAIEIVE